MLRFCAKHGITANRQEIWNRWNRENRLVEAVKKRMLSAYGSRNWDGSWNWSTSKTEDFEQKSLPFGKPSG